MERVNSTILSRTGSEVAMIPEVANHLISSGGKRLRPILVLLSGRMLGDANPTLVRMAAVVEMIHTATLVHDDVIDAAETRRGKPSRSCIARARASFF